MLQTFQAALMNQEIAKAYVSEAICFYIVVMLCLGCVGIIILIEEQMEDF